MQQNKQMLSNILKTLTKGFQSQRSVRTKNKNKHTGKQMVIKISFIQKGSNFIYFILFFVKTAKKIGFMIGKSLEINTFYRLCLSFSTSAILVTKHWRIMIASKPLHFFKENKILNKWTIIEAVITSR